MNKEFLKSKTFKGMTTIALGVVLMNSLENPLHYLGIVMIGIGGYLFVRGLLK